MINEKSNSSKAVFFTFLISVICASATYAQPSAFGTLSAEAGSVSAPVPEPSLAAGVASISDKSFVSRESEKIMRMTDAQLAAASPDKKIEMLKRLMRDSSPNQNNDSSDMDQENLETAILRVLGSSRDAATFDYVYYRLDKGDLERSVGWYKDVRDLVNKHRGSAVPGDWAGLSNYIDTVTKATYSGRNHIQFLIDGKDVIPVASRVLKDAQKSIHIEVFQLQPDKIGRGLADILSAKVKAGVKVRMIIDEHGSNVEHDKEISKMMDEMRRDGIDIRVRPAPHFEKHLDHRKVVVIDGKVGFTGGMNIGSWYQVEWHDQQTLVKGPAVTQLQQSFVEHWKALKGSFGADEDLFPQIDEEPDGYQTRVVGHYGFADQNIKAMYIRAIGTSQKSISIANPYFTDDEVVEALIKAAHRGVTVRIVLPQDNDQGLVQHSSRSRYPKLIKAGVKVYEYKGRMAHEKVAVIDGRWATFGSSNLDARSLINNDELNLVINDFRIGQDIESRLFDADLANCELMNHYSANLMDHLAHAVNGML